MSNHGNIVKEHQKGFPSLDYNYTYLRTLLYLTPVTISYK